MKNLLEDPDVMALYQNLLSKRYQDIQDYLESSPVDDYNYEAPKNNKKESDVKIFFDGEEVKEFVGEYDYGL